MQKRFLSFIMAAIMLFSMTGMNAFAAEYDVTPADEERPLLVIRFSTLSEDVQFQAVEQNTPLDMLQFPNVLEAVTERQIPIDDEVTTPPEDEDIDIGIPNGEDTADDTAEEADITTSHDDSNSFPLPEEHANTVAVTTSSAIRFQTVTQVTTITDVTWELLPAYNT